jgi:hypothetical protein
LECACGAGGIPAKRRINPHSETLEGDHFHAETRGARRTGAALGRGRSPGTHKFSERAAARSAWFPQGAQVVAGDRAQRHPRLFSGMPAASKHAANRRVFFPQCARQDMGQAKPAHPKVRFFELLPCENLPIVALFIHPVPGFHLNIGSVFFSFFLCKCRFTQLFP